MVMALNLTCKVSFGMIKKGNSLTVYNRFSEVDKGVIILKSASQIKAEKEASKLEDASRKF